MVDNRAEEFLEKIYDGNLDTRELREKPILIPIAEVNDSYFNLSKIIQSAVYSFEQEKELYDELVENNPIYKETLIVKKIETLLTLVKQIIHTQDIQRETLKNTVQKLLRVVNSDYGILGYDGKYKPTKLNLKKENSKEEKNKIEKSNLFHSDILERNIPIPEKEINKINKQKDATKKEEKQQ